MWLPVCFLKRGPNIAKKKKSCTLLGKANKRVDVNEPFLWDRSPDKLKSWVQVAREHGYGERLGRKSRMVEWSLHGGVVPA